MPPAAPPRRAVDWRHPDPVLIVALAVDTAIAVVDAYTPTVLINLVVIGPLLAATRTGPRRTAVISAYAVGLAVYEGIPHHIFGTPDHVVRCAAIALTGALAVWSAWLRERRREEQAHTALLAEAGALLNASLNPVATMRNVARLGAEELAGWCAVDVLESDGHIRNLAIAHVDPGKQALAQELRVSYPLSADERSGVAEVLRTRRPVLVPTVTDERLVAMASDARHLELLRSLRMTSAILVPMVARGRTLGAITLISADPHRRFDRDDVAIAQELARRCAMALDNARLYAERTHVAKTLQRSLLPARIPEVPGFEVAAHFHAGTDIEVGGDFFDLFEAGDGWAAIIGDVTGKGAGAAAVTALARYTLRAGADHDDRPSGALRVLNAAILREGLEDRFCTAAYAHLRPQADGARVRLSTGGHPLPLVVRSDGRVHPVGDHGMVLGFSAEPPLEDCEIELGAGDKLVFFTDGVIEARLPHGMLGVDGLARALAACRDCDTVETGERIFRAAVGESGVARDDIAVLVLRACPDGAPRGDEGLTRSGAVGQEAGLNLRLRGGPAAPSAARRALDAVQQPVLDADDAHRARLLVSEVVTNSVRHGGAQADDWIAFEVDVSADGVRVQVEDRGPGFRPHPHQPPPDAVSGRGLFLVDRLADRWGTSDHGRCVWFELDRRQRDGIAGGEPARTAVGARP